MNMARTPLAVAVAVAAMFCVAVAGAAAKPNPHAALDCNYCHLDTPRFGVDTLETVNFWRAEGDEPQLCERCHGPEANFHPLGVTPDPQRRGTQPPKRLPLGKSEAVRDQVVCISCHFLHAADADHALLRGFPGPPIPACSRTGRTCAASATAPGWRSARRTPGTSAPAPSATRPGPSPASRRRSPRPAANSASSATASSPRTTTPASTPTRSGGLHGMPRPAPGQGSPRPSEGRLFRPDPRRGHAQPPPQAHPLLRLPRRREAGPPARRRRGRPLPALPRLREDPGDEPPDDKVPAGYVIPQGWPLSDGAMTCLTCHVAGHAPGSIAGRPDEPAGAPYLLRGADAGQRTTVCFRCHAKSQWAGRNPHQEIARKKTGCTLCHAADPEDGGHREFRRGHQHPLPGLPRRRRPPRRDSPHRDAESRDAGAGVAAARNGAPDYLRDLPRSPPRFPGRPPAAGGQGAVRFLPALPQTLIFYLLFSCPSLYLAPARGKRGGQARGVFRGPTRAGQGCKPHLRRRFRLRLPEEERPQLHGSLPFSRRKNAVLHGESGAADFSLLWLWRGRQCHWFHYEKRGFEFPRGRAVPRRAPGDLPPRVLARPARGKGPQGAPARGQRRRRGALQGESPRPLRPPGPRLSRAPFDHRRHSRGVRHRLGDPGTRRAFPRIGEEGLYPAGTAPGRPVGPARDRRGRRPLPRRGWSSRSTMSPAGWWPSAGGCLRTANRNTSIRRRRRCTTRATSCTGCTGPRMPSAARASASSSRVTST